MVQSDYVQLEHLNIVLLLQLQLLECFLDTAIVVFHHHFREMLSNLLPSLALPIELLSHRFHYINL